jgi:TPR repeat protein
LWDAGKPRAARRLFERGAKAGDPNAQFMFGYFLDVGLGGRTDKVAAMRWYRRAYKQRVTGAANNIAILYREQGRGRLSERWFKHAIAGGSFESTLALGKLHRDVLDEPGKARECFRRMARWRDALPGERDEARALMRAMRVRSEPRRARP